MSEGRDPPRWLESTGWSEDLLRDLAAYGGEAPSGAQRARMLTNVERQLALAEAPSASPAAGATPVLKLAFGAGALLAGALSVLPLWSPLRAALLPAEAHILVPVEPPPAAVASRVSGFSSQPAEWPATSAEVSEVVTPVLRAATSAPAASVAPAKTSPASAPQSAVAASPPPSAGDPVAELSLLASARRALLGQPTRALQLAEAHAQAFPRGTFAEEREVLAIEALLKLGRRQDAKRRARAFEQRFPNSTHRAHLTAIVAETVQREGQGGG